MIGSGPARFYVDWSAFGLKDNPAGWTMHSEYASREGAERAMEKLIADTIHDSDPDRWRVSGDLDAEKEARDLAKSHNRRIS